MMRIQARLFLGTSVLVLALIGVQWWLHLRQVQALEQELGQMAAEVGKGLLSGPIEIRTSTAAQSAQKAGTEDADLSNEGNGAHSDGASPEGKPTAKKTEVRHELRTEVHMTMLPDEDQAANGGSGGSAAGERQSYELKVIQMDPVKADRLLIVRSKSGLESRVPIPIASTIESVTRTEREGLVLSVALLVVGLVASAWMARRVARPLQQLAESAATLGEGHFGAQVPVTASGEVGELQQAFNQMSARLEQLEAERERWRQREHLIQLGQLAKGLGHTLRNPLNTLGLVVEELAGGRSDASALIPTARRQIARIDRWLRSFLALGAGEGAACEPCSLAEILGDVVLEAAQGEVPVELELADPELVVSAVEGALRAALSNLLENAVEASPAGDRVKVFLERDDGDAVVRITDRGRGLPPVVREELFSPHVTTKSEGSGMGLYLARQLIVEMHGGQLRLRDREGGGTEAIIRLPRIVLPQAGGGGA